MSKGNTFENDLLKLIFNGTGIANMADNTSSSPLTSLYVALHVADPGEAGSQNTSEAAYTGYTRVAVARNSGGFTVVNNVVSPTANISFPECSAGSAVITHFSIGTNSSGSGKILYYGTITPTITATTGVTPVLTTASTITED